MPKKSYTKNKRKGRILKKKPFRRTRKKTRSNEIVVSKCKPGLKGQLSNTCFTKDIVNTIKKHYNVNNEIKINATSPKTILQRLKKHTNCDDEKCWIKLLPPHLRNNVKNYLYRPLYPKEWHSNKNAWLSNFDILAVINQYEESNPNFKFIGPTFIDFDERSSFAEEKCVEDELCEFNLNYYLDKNITKIGIIFNLDTHDQSGSHWVSLFIDLTDNFIFYFNSTGENTPKEIKALCLRIQEQARAKNIELTYIKNGLEHQKEDTECGMYSLFFIISMLTDSIGGDTNQKLINLEEKKKFFKKTRIPDKDMEKLRDKYFIK